MYKIEEELFYTELCKDIAGEAFGFNDLEQQIMGKFGRNEATKWIVDYELNKLRDTLIRKNMTRSKFKKDFNQNEDGFCQYIVPFLPKKRRKKLWKKLQKDIRKGKLNHHMFDDE